MAIYRIKRFGRVGDIIQSAATGGFFGAGIGYNISKSNTGAAIGAALGTLGTAYLKHKLNEGSIKNQNELKKKKEEQEKFRYPTKDMENLYPIIEEFGGLPKEYYNAVQISKKISNLSSIPSWGDQDEYAFFNVRCLGSIEEAIENYNYKIEKLGIICLGYQSTYMDISYNPKTKKWIDLGYNKVIGTGNLLKNYILKWFNEELKNLRIDLKKLNQDDEEYDMWKEVEKFYEDQIKIIQQSPF
jgi:hypothetical protein